MFAERHWVDDDHFCRYKTIKGAVITVPFIVHLLAGD